MKIAISTIAKNEEKNIEGFIKSCEEADLISVLDTGSTDKTIELLKKHNAYAGQKIINPFKFDEARNAALEKLPEDIDIVISVDLDERINKGWRKELEKMWNENSESVSYWYIGEWQDEGKTKPLTEGWRTKIFRRKGYKWFNFVHEIPLPEDKRQPRMEQCKNIVVKHLQQGERNYEPLLSELIKKEPDNQEAYIQRAAEYSKLQEWQRAINDFEKYIELSRKEHKCVNGCPRCELLSGRRAFCYIDIAQCKLNLGYQLNIVIPDYLKAVGENPNIREAWTYLAQTWFNIGDYPQAYACAMTAMNIKDSGIHSKNALCWGDYPKKIAKEAYKKICQ